MLIAIPTVNGATHALTPNDAPDVAGAMLFNKRFTAAWAADGYRDYLSPETRPLETGKTVLSRLLGRGPGGSISTGSEPSQLLAASLHGYGGLSGAPSSPPSHQSGGAVGTPTAAAGNGGSESTAQAAAPPSRPAFDRPSAPVADYGY